MLIFGSAFTRTRKFILAQVISKISRAERQIIADCSYLYKTIRNELKPVLVRLKRLVRKEICSIFLEILLSLFKQQSVERKVLNMEENVK